jgi:hypothetical protein
MNLRDKRRLEEVLRCPPFTYSLWLFLLRESEYNNYPIERLHSFPRDQLNKSYGGHVGVL